MMTDRELQRIERELCERVGNGMDVVATADFATRALTRMLAEVRRLHSENAQLQAKTRLVA